MLAVVADVGTCVGIQKLVVNFHNTLNQGYISQPDHSYHKMVALLATKFKLFRENKILSQQRQQKQNGSIPLCKIGIYALTSRAYKSANTDLQAPTEGGLCLSFL